MRERKWIIALTALIAGGLIAAGCGSDDESTTTISVSDTSPEVTVTDASTTTEASTTTSDSGGTTGSTPDDVYNACIDVIKGTAAESAGETACAQARDAFEQCAKQADAAPEGDARDLAIQACQDAADQATQALQAGA